ncbi:MAG: dihydroorotase, partial [Gammaproteobacteria bacterium]|nr:dihydroorotase [Gammaproteobacteria bacterium]
MTEKLQIRGGRVIDPSQGIDEVSDLFVADGVVKALGKAPDGFTPDLLLEAKGCVVTPGFVDLSARLREPGLEHKATIRSESMAAVAGGITTLVIPPDTLPVVDTPAVVQWIFDRAKAQGFV